MNKLNEAFLDQLRAIVGPEHVVTRSMTRHSRDFYWFSPILKEELDDKVAQVMVRPETVEQVRQLIALAVRERVPIIPRGAGTGNYGQAMPMHGGMILRTRRMNRILELTPEYAKVEAGVLLNTIEQEARQIGAELRFFPSTLTTSTAAGFLAGGSTGIGSIRWGNLWDAGNVLSATVLTIEKEPQLLTLSDPEALQAIIHNCGLTAIITDLTFALAQAQAWQQYVVAFDGFEDALRFGESLAYDDTLIKRLITVVEWPIPSYFVRLVKENACPESKALLLLHLAADPEEVEARVTSAGGEVTWHSPTASQHRGGVELSDFTWNHTTLWAIKADPTITYLQDGFDSKRFYEQLRLRKARYGDDIYEHIEFGRSGGHIRVTGLTLVRFKSKEHLLELMEYCESIGIIMYNPHTTYLDDDKRWNGQPILDAKAKWDPHNLLNPGHLRALEHG